VPNQARYERQKARATRRAVTRAALSAPVTGPFAPSLVPGRSFLGIHNPNVAPPDETSAVGTTRYIELVNTNFAIYNKTSNSPISTGTINSLAGAASTDSVFDVQVIWDPTTSRFYYAADDVVSSSDNELAFGFSKTASPGGAADFCKYTVGFGTVFPDYPKLGDSRFFAMIGSNLFSGNNSFLGSDLLAMSNPPAGTSCPSASSFKLADAASLLISASTQAFTPVPANEIDTKATGFAVARPAPLPATQLSLFKVTRDATTGNPVIQSTGTPVTVASYMWPANAPQNGSVNALDTLDARSTQSVAGVDPGHAGKFAIWTQHTINVGGRAAVRWYEIDPAAHSLLQSGTASNASWFQFNGAISPNRQVNGATKTGGDAMVLNFDTSSSTTSRRSGWCPRSEPARSRVRSWSRARQAPCPGSIATRQLTSAAGATTPPQLPIRPPRTRSGRSASSRSARGAAPRARRPRGPRTSLPPRRASLQNSLAEGARPARRPRFHDRGSRRDPARL
jgi:hypothetical protein